MSVNDLVIRLDATTSQYDVKFSAAQKTTLRYEAAVASASTAAEALTVAVTETGAASERSAAAQAKYSAALQRSSAAQERAAIAGKRAAEQMVADQTAAAAATERAAAKEIAAVDAAAKASTKAALAQARAAASTSAAINAEVLTFERAAAKEVAAQESATRATQVAATKRAAALKSTGSAFGVVGAASAASLFLAAKAAADFNAKMAQVQSLTRASATDMARLSDATQNYANLGISATSAADAEIELVKAGISVKDIMGGALTGTLNLAAAGQLDVADATSIAAQAMTQFQLQGKDIPHVADLLAAGADKALGSVQDLGEGLKYSGLLAHQTGLSIGETVAVLSEFAQAGLIGSQGGTALQQVLRQLIAPTDKANAEIQALGLSLYDSQGNFVGLSSVAGQLHDKLGPLSSQQQQLALNTIFTSRAVRGATILFQDGAKGVDSWQQKVQVAGFAAQQASGKMDSLSGDLQKLQASVTNAGIALGQSLQGPLRTVAQSLTSVFDVAANLPGPLKELIVLTVAYTAALGLGTFAYSRARLGLASMGKTLGVVTVEEGKAGLAAQLAANKMLLMKVGSGALGLGLLDLSSRLSASHNEFAGLAGIAGDAALGFSVGGPWGAAIGGAVGILTHLGGAAKFTSTDVQALTDTFNTQTGAITDNTRALVVATLQQQGVLTAAREAGLNLSTVTDAAIGNATAINQLKGAYQALDPVVQGSVANSAAARIAVSEGTAATTGAAAANSKFATATKTVLDAVLGENGALAASRQVYKDKTAAMGDGKTAADAEAGATKGLTGATKANTLATQQETLAQQALNTVVVGRLNSVAALTLQIDSASKATKGLTGATNANHTAINLQSVAGATLAQTLTGIASTAAQVTGNTRTQTTALDRAREAIKADAEQAGLGSKAAQDLADKLLMQAVAAQHVTDTPAVTHVSTEGDVVALAKIKDFVAQANSALVNINGQVVPITLAAQSSKVLNQLGGNLGLYAEGGPITGGVRGKDSVLLLGMPGEHMLTTSDVAMMGGQAGVLAFRQQIQSGHIPAFATGGPVISPRVNSTGLTSAVSHVESLFGSFVDSLGAAVSKKVNAALANLSFLGASSGASLGNGLFRPVAGPITQGLHDQWTGFPAIDIGVPVGTPVHAGAAGRVTKSEDIYGNQNGGYASYGRYIQLLSSGFSTLYAHLSGRGVAVGQSVAGGQAIGLSGDTGNSTGPHLHFGAQGIDPNAFFTTPVGSGAAAGISGVGVARWAPVISQALALLHQSPSWLPAVEGRMQRESSGNPTIVNTTDSNWAAGTPSVGLMQVIGPTFDAYAGPYRSVGPYEYGVSTNPLANTYAGLNYALHRYGSLSVMNAPGGYDQGGPLHPGWTMAYNGTGRTETVVPQPPHVVDRMMQAAAPVSVDMSGVEARLDRLEASLTNGRQRVQIDNAGDIANASTVVAERVVGRHDRAGKVRTLAGAGMNPH